eukprot:1179683-Prorocentrum_minimum.AAC.1
MARGVIIRLGRRAHDPPCRALNICLVALNIRLVSLNILLFLLQMIRVHKVSSEPGALHHMCGFFWDNKLPFSVMGAGMLAAAVMLYWSESQ